MKQKKNLNNQLKLRNKMINHLNEKGKSFRNEIFKLNKSDFKDLFKILQENSKVSDRKRKEPRLINYLLRRRDVKNLLKFDASSRCSWTGRRK